MKIKETWRKLKPNPSMIQGYVNSFWKSIIWYKSIPHREIVKILEMK